MTAPEDTRQRWLVTGAGGMLAHDVVELLTAADEEVVAIKRADLDITDPAAVRGILVRHQPTVVVNCAAWTAVDDAETNEQAALRVNGDGVHNVAEACATDGTRLIHTSTDYVFAGDGTTPYAEDDPVDPRTAYGRTKAAGEQAVAELLPQRGVVVRTAWLYGAHGPNFVATMLRLEQTKDTVDVVADQRGQPTWTRDVAERIVTLGSDPRAHGVYHATNTGEATWYDLAREVFRLQGANLDRVQPTTSEAFVRPAPRPAYSVLGHDRWAELGIPDLRDWRAALTEAFPEVLHANDATGAK